MSKRISFISPVDHLSGNLSGRQNLVYAENDNKAFEAPNGRQYARNYKTRFIGAYRASDAKAYFQVRTKSATKLSTSSRLAMAVLGAAASLAEVIMGKNSTWATIKANVQASFDAGVVSGDIQDFKTAKTWLASYLRVMYASKSDSVSLPNYAQPGTLLADIYNQFVVAQLDEQRDPSLDSRILVKFWKTLSRDGILFKVNGQNAVAFDGENFGYVIDGGHNVLNLKANASDYVLTANDEYVIKGEDYMDVSSRIADGDNFGTTTTAPA